MFPQISVIIPNYNHARFLQQRIESVLAQTLQDFELIILDDCSTDESRNIIDSYRGNDKISQIVFNEANSGSPFKQWEKGISLAKGKYIWIAESDDYCSPTFLEAGLKSFENQQQSVYYCQSYNIDENDTIINENFWWTKDIKGLDWDRPFTLDGKEFIKKALQYQNVIPNASAVLFLKRNINFNELNIYRTAGDWLFWINMLMEGDITYSNEILNKFRTHSATTRHQSTHQKFLRRHYEILAVKHTICDRYKIGEASAVGTFLNLCIEISHRSDLFVFSRFCFQFDLPKWFVLKFIYRKLKDTVQKQVKPYSKLKNGILKNGY